MNILDKVNSLIIGTVYADEKVEIKAPADTNIGKIDAQSLISGLITLIFAAASLVFFFMLIFGGIKWMTAGGDKEKTGEARSQLTSALIGLVIVFLAWMISTLIGKLFGVDILNLTIPNLYK